MRLFISICLVAIAGCSARQEFPTFAPTEPSEVEVVDRIYQGLVPMGRVRGVACDEGFISRTKATRAVAVTNAKKEAAMIGASGIANVKTSLVRDIFKCNGLGGVIVTATAYKK